MRILYLEDELDIAEAVLERLERERYEVVHFTSPEALLGRVADAPVDAAVLDVMIGRDDDAGFELARALREAGYLGAILFVSARDGVADRVHGLDLGGDDYLVKPFSLDELVARVRALLRRDGTLRRAIVEVGRLHVDLVRRVVAWDGDTVDLSDREFALLELLAHDPTRVHPADEIADRVFPAAATGPAIVRVYVGHLRRKLHPEAIVTARGGYRLGDA